MTMTGEGFRNLIEQAFNPFLVELGFQQEKPHVSGRYYRVSFIRNIHKLIISFEPGDNHLTIMVLKHDDYDLSSIDDTLKTPRLSDLNRMYMASVTSYERAHNEAFFSAVNVKNNSEQALLKCAKELRLVLPRYLKDQTCL